MGYQLKKSSPAFEVVAGPFKGRRYEHGRIYQKSEIPSGEFKKFDAVKKAGKKTAKQEEADK